MAMTSEAKRALSTTTRALRGRLLDDLHAATESAYRLSVRVQDARLDEAKRTRRAHLETWIAEQQRTQGTAAKVKGARQHAQFRRDAEKQAAYTLLNRLVILRIMETQVSGATPMRAPALVTGGWESPAYRTFRELAPALVQGDETEGYAFLLQLAFEDLAGDLPGLYGPIGIADLIPIPAATLRHVVETLDANALESCWTDEMTLGWIYQYWNDPEREALDGKLHAGGKVAPHEIASKTQMFTERYMVDWLLQNSLGPMWLAMCRKHGWTAEVEAGEHDGRSVLERLDERRADWRAKRDAGEVSLTELMPLDTDVERHWAYYVPQPIPDDAVAHAPESVRDLKLIDPAVGSGHFLVVALDLLVALYHEEARHRREASDGCWTDRAIVERILSHNLHGIDLDPRAVQIAAAALWLAGRRVAPEAHPEQMNLVASNLRLGSLADHDPALMELREEVERETGIPAALTDTIVHALKDADHLGSLLKVDRAVDEAIETHEEAVAAKFAPQQLNLDGSTPAQQAQMPFEAALAKQSLVDRLEGFLARHTGGEDLGLRMRGEQLAAGVRFVRLVREGSYDLVVANPPYQGTSKMADASYVETTYPLGKADLYAAFLLRGLQLARTGGVSAMLTMRNWMFIKQFAALREHLLPTYDLRALGDFDRGAFEEVPDEVVSVAVGVFHRTRHAATSVAICPTPREDRSRDAERTSRKRAATLCHAGRREFVTDELKIVPEWPLVYWWTSGLVRLYEKAALMRDIAPVRLGLGTRNDPRFIRRWFELPRDAVYQEMYEPSGESPVRLQAQALVWAPVIMGSKARAWLEPLQNAINWRINSLELMTWIEHYRLRSPGGYLRNLNYNFTRGVSYSPVGHTFSARAHRFVSVFHQSGASVFPQDIAQTVCLLNSSFAASVIESLNPSIGFQISDIERLPLRPIADSQYIFDELCRAFAIHESRREPSVEFVGPGPSPWRDTQYWAKAEVDRPEGKALSTNTPSNDNEASADHLSFALGVVLGRFDAAGGGILNHGRESLPSALPAGILLLDGTLNTDHIRGGLGHAAAAPLREAWTTHGPQIETNRKSLREWLALDFFKDVHRPMYENRPIHWPLSSAKRTFVAWVNIHRFTDQTLRILLADHLHPALNRLEGELADLRTARESPDKRSSRKAEKRYADVVEARDELLQFIANVEQCADRGAPPADVDEMKCRPRQQDARYVMDLDDGVMINSAGLWPLLEPQWKDPKKWWRELSNAQGKKDYDWSHLAMRYWPTRVDDKCQGDPSLGVAHGCFWRHHPARAWAWELRLQDEIGGHFRIEESPYQPGGRELGDQGDRPHRDAWLRDHPEEALAAVEKETLRRIRKHKAAPPREMRIIETGLWSALPAEVWEMELGIAERLGDDFHLRAPDEPLARAAYEAVYPERASARADFLATLVPAASLLDDPDDDAEAVDADAVDDDDDAAEESNA